jgi:hypothetical protein
LAWTILAGLICWTEQADSNRQKTRKEAIFLTEPHGYDLNCPNRALR